MHGGGNFATGKDNPFQRGQVGCDDAQRQRHIRKPGVGIRPHQPILHGEAPQESPARREGGIDEAPKRPAGFQFPREPFELAPVASVRPKRAHVGSHARPGHHVHLDAVLLQNLDHPYMCEAFRRAG